MPRKRNYKKPGPDPQLNDELFVKIKKLILDGKNIQEIAKATKIPVNTFYKWTSTNYINISDKIELWKTERKLKLANDNLEEILAMETTNKRVSNDGDVDEFTDTGILRVKADLTKFTLETLDKERYSKRSEVTGKDGGAIEHKISKQEEEEIDEIIKDL